MKKQCTYNLLPAVAMRSVAVLVAGAFLFTTLGAAPVEASFGKNVPRRLPGVKTNLGRNRPFWLNCRCLTLPY
ncbi:MAG: hypothetical protein IPN90_05460 [Elusimicrobia bacterium]|nr:hypothetical protein [Elusimicrobiota bacterium]